MKVGAEPKKIAILGGLLAVALITLYLNVFSTNEQQTAGPRPVAPPAATAAAAPAAANIRRDVPARKVAGKAAVGEFRPVMGFPNAEERPDPASVDPALHLDLLAKLQAVEMVPAGRNLFQYGSAPAPPAPKPPPMPEHPPTIPITQAPVITPPGPPPPPPPTPVNFKYYGYKTARSTGVKLAFLLDGEEIIVAGENEVVKKRYRVVRIAPNSITVEDMEGKGQQTIQIEGQPAA